MGSDYNTAGGQNPMTVLQNFRQLLPQLAQLVGGQTSGAGMSQLQSLNQLYNPGDVSQLANTAKGNATSAQAAFDAASKAQHQHPNPANQQALQAAKQNLMFANNANTTAMSNASQGQPLGINQLNAQNRQAFDTTVNPQYAQAQNAASRGAASAVGAINLNGLSPGESNAVERSLNQTNTATGNAGLINPTNVISNAMNFGGAFNSKIPLMNQAVGAASGAANSASTMGGFTPIGGQPITAQSAQNAFGYGQGLGSQMFGANSAAQGAGATMAGQTAIPAYLNSVNPCCFIFLESLGGKLPVKIREARDRYYRRFPLIANGYVRMAKWLVPMMRSNKLVKWLVWQSMVKPMVKHSTTYRKMDFNRTISIFWLKTWVFIGNI